VKIGAGTRTLLMFACVVLAGIVGSAPATGAFRVGIAAPTVNMLPLWIGQRSGLFKAHGLEVAIVNTDGGSRGLKEVGSGRLQAMIVGLSAVVDANAKGGDYRAIASAANTMSFRFFGAKGIASAKLLKGKKVGISAFGSESDSAAVMALKQLGLDRREVQFVEAGGTLRRLNALKSGAFAATPLNEPADSAAGRDALPLLVDLKANLPWIFTAIVMDRLYLAAHNPEAKGFVRAYIEGIYLALSDPVRAKAVLASEFKGFPPAVLQAAYEDFKARVPRDAEPSREGATTMLRELPSLGSPVKSTNIADYIDSTLLEDLRREGFFDAMKKKYRVN